MALNGANATNAGQYVVAADGLSSQQQQQQQQLQHQAMMQHHQDQMNNTAAAMAAAAAAANNGNMANNTTTPLTANSLTTFALMGLSGPLHFPGVAAGTHHMNANPATAIPSPQPTSTKIPIPAIFQGKKMRFGKWTAEEEEYCDLLIKQFENGWMEGCENGCTLRSFLARKLHCAPMRISKKYAGRGIGKMIFLAKTNSTNGVLTMTEAQLAENAVKLREAECKFYKSIYPNINMIQAPANRLLVDNPVMHPPGFNPMGQLVPSSQPVNFYPMQTAVTVPMPMNNVAPSNPAQATTTAMASVSGNVTLNSPWQGLHLPTGNAVQAPTSENAGHINDLTNTLQLSYLNVLQHLQQGSNPIQGNVQKHVTATEQQDPVTNGLIVVPPAAPARGPGHHSNASEIPDFLSGFERVAAVAANETNANTDLPKDGLPWISVTPQVASASDSTSTEQHSPPFTSKSFDEFHRLLGNDLSPLHKMENMHAKVSDAVRIPHTESLSLGTSGTAAAAGSSQALSRPFTIAPRPDTTEKATSFTADSYALFAQESARAVSEHSAYSLSNGLHRLLAPPQEELTEPKVSAPKSRDFMTLTNTNANHNSNNNSSSCSSNSGERNEFFGFQPALESASAFLSHIYKASRSNIVSGSEESGSAREGSGMDSTTGSDNASNDSDSNSEDGPAHKKLKRDHNGDCIANSDNDRVDMTPLS